MPRIWPEVIEWNEGNESHATAHGVSREEIEQVITHGAIYRRNKRGRAADFLAFGTTSGGRPVVVAVAWDQSQRSVRPITAWEDR